MPPGAGARTVTSIYQLALGSDFERLHPRIQQRFGFSSTDRIASIGEGVMEEVWRGRPDTPPFLFVGSWGRVMFPDHGTSLPFRGEKYAYVDGLGTGKRTRRHTLYIH